MGEGKQRSGRGSRGKSGMRFGRLLTRCSVLCSVGDFQARSWKTSSSCSFLCDSDFVSSAGEEEVSKAEILGMKDETRCLVPRIRE
jgi:hypothetical protein